MMKKISMFALLVTVLFAATSCKKNSGDSRDVNTPRSTSVPSELIGRWAIVGISGSTVYDIPAGSTHNTNEVFLGYEIKSDGTTREDGYAATYQYGVSTWTKWTAYGSVQFDDGGIVLHRAYGSYTSSRNGSLTNFPAAEVYPNKSFAYVHYELGDDGRGNPALLLTDEEGVVHTYVKQ
jgi:hypothetical protein